MILLTLKEIKTLDTKQLWTTFTWSYQEYIKSPFTNKGEKFYNQFRTAKQELKSRKKGWWN
jgi:hypothetical protein